MTVQEKWQVSGSEAEFYERYKVPRQLKPLALLLLDRVPFGAGQRVLDVACGTGIVARLAAPRLGPTGRIVGLDLNPAMLAVARSNAPLGANIEWKQGDAAALPFADAAFDVVLCQQGLQFFPDKAAALREMHRVLSPGGVLGLNVYSAPNRYQVALAAALTKYVDENTAMQSLAPFAFGKVEELRRLLSLGGFTGAEIQTSAVTRRIEPSQQWLLEDTAGVPYASAIAALDPAARAAMIRGIAGALKDLWEGDSFAVAFDVHFVCAKK